MLPPLFVKGRVIISWWNRTVLLFPIMLNPPSCDEMYVATEEGMYVTTGTTKNTTQISLYEISCEIASIPTVYA